MIHPKMSTKYDPSLKVVLVKNSIRHSLSTFSRHVSVDIFEIMIFFLSISNVSNGKLHLQKGETYLQKIRN